MRCASGPIAAEAMLAGVDKLADQIATDLVGGV
jgi:hypothetical protein